VPRPEVRCEWQLRHPFCPIAFVSRRAAEAVLRSPGSRKAMVLRYPCKLNSQTFKVCSVDLGPLARVSRQNQKNGLVLGPFASREPDSRAGFALYRLSGRRVLDDNLLVLLVPIMPRVQEPAMKTAIMPDYDFPHASMMPFLYVLCGMRR